MAERQSDRMSKITNDGLTRSGTYRMFHGYIYMAINSGRQRVKHRWRGTSRPSTHSSRQIVAADKPRDVVCCCLISMIDGNIKHLQSPCVSVYLTFLSRTTALCRVDLFVCTQVCLGQVYLWAKNLTIHFGHLLTIHCLLVLLCLLSCPVSRPCILRLRCLWLNQLQCLNVR